MLLGIQRTKQDEGTVGWVTTDVIGHRLGQSLFYSGIQVIQRRVTVDGCKCKACVDGFGKNTLALLRLMFQKEEEEEKGGNGKKR